MIVYLVKFNQNDYDEYDGFVVVAETREDAVKVVEEEHPQDDKYSSVDWKGGYTVKEVPLDIRGIVLGSFNAG